MAQVPPRDMIFRSTTSAGGTPVRHALRALAAGLGFAALFAVLPAQAADPAAPLIERSKVFGNPSRAGAQLSPDGKWLSWLAPRDGVMNVWLAPVAKLSDSRPLTSSRDRPIRQQFWAPDSSMVMYIQDKGGDENFLLYGIDVATGAGAQPHAVREDARAAGRRLASGQGPHPRRPQQSRPALARRAQPRPEERQADRDHPRRRFRRLRRRREPRAAHGHAAECGGRVRLLPRCRQQGRGAAVLVDPARGFAHHAASGLHRGRQDALLDRQPRPQYGSAHRAGRRDRRDARPRRESARRHR